MPPGSTFSGFGQLGSFARTAQRTERTLLGSMSYNTLRITTDEPTHIVPSPLG